VQERIVLIQDAVAAVRANQRAVDDFDTAVIEHLGVHRTDGRCLELLGDGVLSPTALAKALGLTTGAVTMSLDRLEGRGLVQRAADPSDRRRIVVNLTESARQQMSEIFGPMIAESAKIFEDCTDDELRFLARVMSRGSEVLTHHRARIRADDGAAE
jgi:DNA-binding MarR family transcriptional regulator